MKIVFIFKMWEDRTIYLYIKYIIEYNSCKLEWSGICYLYCHDEFFFSQRLYCQTYIVFFSRTLIMRFISVTLNNLVTISFRKFVLESYLKHTDTCSADFQAITKHIGDAINAIRPGEEYSGTFIDVYKWVCFIFNYHTVFKRCHKRKSR